MGVQHKVTKRKQYSREFKREAVRLVAEGGLSIAQAAQDLGLDDNMVSRWKKEAKQNGQRAFPSTTDSKSHTVLLKFSGALDAGSAVDLTHYRVQVNGGVVAIESRLYSTNSDSVTL